MGLKKRLVVAFLILLIVPVLLIGVTATVIISYQHNAIERGTIDSEDGRTIYYAVRSNNIEKAQVRMPLLETGMCIALIIVLTAAVLVMWLYRSLIRPLNVLKMATKNMKEGNLDFTISGDPQDELGQLCEDFEEMRVRLKEQIDARMKYEQDTVELISNISHDLKTPLTAIKGYAEGLLDGVADTDEKRDKYVRTIYTKASDMTVLVEELSFFSKIDSNIVPYNFGRLPVNAYFTDCVDEQSLDTEVCNITLEYSSQVGDDVAVRADAEQIGRVVSNLIGNAVKYMDKPKGRIIIGSRLVQNMVEISVEDNGCGISEEDLPHVFERFFRADSSRGTRKGGSGLGLAISKKIVEDHGGTFTVSAVKGEGSRFCFTLPVYTGNVRTYSEIEDAEYNEVKKGKQ